MAFPADNCNPRIVSVDDSCGCTLTRASIIAMTKTVFEDQGLREVGMDKVIAATKEARMTGVRENSLMDLMLSRHVPLKTGTVPMLGQSVIAPFVYRPQRHHVNANYFVVTAGTATPGAGTGSIPTHAWDVTVENSSSLFATSLVQLQKFFSPGHYVTIIYKDTANGNIGRTLQYKVYASVNADVGPTAKATLTLIPNYTAAGWAGLSASDKTVFQPTTGLLIPMANSVSDYEVNCYNRPSIQTGKLLTYWLQTIRETHCYNDEYIKALQAPHTSEYWRKFKMLPLSDQKRQQAYAAELAYFNTIFYGQRIDEKQSDSTYTDLPQVVDPADTDCVLEYKSNTLGLRTQLADCSRVIDFEGGPLDLDTIKAQLYNLKRYRGNTSGTIDTIDAFTDRHTRDRIKTKMIAYYKLKYGLETTRYYQANQALMFNQSKFLGYDIYDLEDEGVQFAVFSHDYFDDKLSSTPTADKPTARGLWLIDWSDFEIGLAKASSVQRKTNEADNLYNCVIKPNINHYQLMSKTIAAMLQDPNRSLMFENFSDECPELTISTCNDAS